jgi:hypothetical protein
MSKRRRFVTTSVLLSLGFVAIQFLTDQNRFWAIAVLSVATAILFAWSLYEGLGKNMTLLTLVLPTIFTLGVGTFWFLLPANIYAGIPIVIFFGISIYILCSTMNIFTVSTIRTIALLRVARGFGFIYSLVTSFLIFDAALSLRLPLYFIIPLTIVLSFPLFLQGFWFIVLEKEYSGEQVRMAFLSSFILAEVATALFFWPVTAIVGAEYITLAVYLLLGLGQNKLDGRLFLTTIREHLVIGALIFVYLFMLATHWA